MGQRKGMVYIKRYLIPALAVSLLAAGQPLDTRNAPASVCTSYSLQAGTQQPAAVEGVAFNCAPSVEGALYETAQGVALYGSLRTYDPEGDALSAELVSPPQKGQAVFEGTAFCYTPFPGETGEDRFTLIVRDRYGNRSQEAVICVSIASGSGLPYFCDLMQSPYAYSVRKLAEAGVFGGEQVGSRLFFSPQREMRRGELLVLLLACSGQDNGLAPCVSTGLSNDADIPLWLKPYILRAMEAGIVLEEAFDTETVPTRAEAVVLCCRAAGINDVAKYRLSLQDVEKIPDWAIESYLNLAAYRMLPSSDGYAYPAGALTREYAAALGWQLYKYACSNRAGD